MQETSTKPYLLRALYEWCTDNGYTPHIAVRVDNGTRVPRQFVRDGEIVLNISFDATSSLNMGNEVIEFNARFSGKSHKIEVPIDNVLAIYARENGQGMAFPVEDRSASAEAGATPLRAAPDHPRDSEDTAVETDTASEEGAGPASRNASESNSARDTDGPADGEDGDGPKSGRSHLKIIK